ncbi:MAG: PolC-type DNA polymerase III [Acholeplasma sp.]|nr:PolC-type DNA polymerase III [Acholeplasma sp.]
MNKYELFLKQSGFKDEQLNQSTLRNVLVDSNKKSWTFFITFKKAPEPKSLDLFIKQLKLYFAVPNVVLSIEYQLSFTERESWQNSAMDYYQWVLQNLTFERASLNIFRNFNCRYQEGQFYLEVDEKSHHLNRYLPFFTQAFLRVGIQTTINLEIKKDLTSVETLIKKDETKAISELKALPPKEKQEPKKALKNFKRVYKTDKISPISEIPKDNYELDKYQNTTSDLSFAVEGTIIKSEVRTLKNSSLLQMTVADRDDAIIVKQFLYKEQDIKTAESYKINDIVRVMGRAQYDTFAKDVLIIANLVEFIEKTSKKERKDTAKEKRVEFHLHTKMSNMDGITDVKDYVDQAIKWGHKAIAFTDHDGLYAYPDIAKATKGKDIKPIYGVELNYVDETGFKMAYGEKPIDLRKATYVVFDIETTGLSSTRDKIIEISAVKVESMQVVSQFSTFVNPEEKISAFTTELTSITDTDLIGAPKIEEALPKFLDFCEGAILVAHNATFDIGHIYANMERLKIKAFEYPVIDTLNMARYFYNESLKKYNLKAVAKLFKVKLEQHHRATDDAMATAQIFIQMLQDLLKKGIETHEAINQSIDLNEAWRHGFGNHVNVLVQNQVGYKNLFKLISDALTTHFYGGPRLLKQTIFNHREGLLFGSGCYKGQVFEAALNKSEKDLREAISFYDYIEVQPPIAYRHIKESLGDDADLKLQTIIKNIIRIATEENKIVIATGDVHYLNEADAIYRDIYIRTKLVGGGTHDLARYPEAPIQYFMTTDEMLEAFKFLGTELAFEIVVKNTNKLNNQIDAIQAFPKALYSLRDDAFKEKLGIESIKEAIYQLVYSKAKKLYGDPLHPIVTKRVERELKNIIENEFGPIYYISYLLTKKSLDDGYLVGSRGSVGSSLVATLMEITEVNPLRPHYRCPNGDFTVFKMTPEDIETYGITELEQQYQTYFEHVQSGYDLPNCVCPHCKAQLEKDGQDIPFETFLGFNGDKVPDIDLNFSGEYQAKAHNYVKELLGEDHAFRAGTIQTVAERNAFGYVKGFLEDKQMTNVRNAQVERLAKNIEGVKRSTGQHPGGIVVVPDEKEIFDVTPIQYPADDTTSEWKTTHFDYHSFEDNLLKLDILGHDDPTMIKFLMDYVEQYPEEFPFSKAQDIPVDDKKVYELFGNTTCIGLDPEDLGSEVASFGIPELGTNFVRQMLTDTKPDSFAGLVKISGLSHGTDVWLKNAQDLVLNKKEEFQGISFDQVIGCRDDIMVNLMDFGMDPLKSFEIMEFVRRGKPSKDKEKWASYEDVMIRNGVPKWYIWSCSQIKYMFPKAHAAAYVLMAVRIAWFKVYKPLLFYSAFFSKRADQFDYETMVLGTNAIRNKLQEYGRMFNLSVKDESIITNLQIALEMTLRGFKFLKVDINKSEAIKFKIEDNALRMPFVSIDGLGTQVALDIVEKRNEKAFSSKEDVKTRSRINKTVFEKMEIYGGFDDLIEENDVIEQGLFAL